MSRRGKKTADSSPLQDVRNQRINRVRMFSKYSTRLVANATLDNAGVLTIEVEMTPLWQHFLNSIKRKVLSK